MRSFCILLVLALVPLGADADADAGAAAHADAAPPRQILVARELWNALGGDEGWNRARHLRFDWIVEKDGKRVVARSHYWDRFTGRYRVDGVDDKEGPYSVYLDVNKRTGQAWVAGKKLTDAAQNQKWVDDGYGAFINDSYWLLAPFKVFDPGVTLADGGEAKGPKGEVCDVIKLSFAGVGLTPKDIYWLFVDRTSHLVVEWKYVLGGEAKPPTAFAWSGWQHIGPIELASMRTGIGKPAVIHFDNLKVSGEVDEAALTPPK